MIQTIGRAARNANGRVIMYADVMTESMNKAIFETQRRRQLQQAYNEAHGIVPKTVMKSVRDVLQIGHAADESDKKRAVKRVKELSEDELHLLICSTEEKMLQAAANLDFELAAKLRDKLFELQGKKPEELPEEKPSPCPSASGGGSGNRASTSKLNAPSRRDIDARRGVPRFPARFRAERFPRSLRRDSVQRG